MQKCSSSVGLQSVNRRQRRNTPTQIGAPVRSRKSVGCRPAFNYPPGGRLANLPKFITEKLDASVPDIAVSVLPGIVSGPAFKQFYDKPDGFFPVAILPDSHMSEIGAKAHTVRLSAETMLKQKEVHPELLPDEYDFVQRTIDAGEKIQDTDVSLIYLLQEDAGGYVSVVKATRTGKAVFLTSFRRLSSEGAKRSEEIKRLLNKGKNNGG